MSSIEERFWSKVDKSGECWTWAAAMDRNGYGVFALTSKDVRAAHRFAYSLANGDIPAGIQIDHICRNPACLRIDHLRAVTPAQNCQHLDQSGHRDNKSGHRGVSWESRSNKWRVRAFVAGKEYWGGLFDDVDDAAEAARALRNRHMTHNDADRSAA